MPKSTSGPPSLDDGIIQIDFDANTRTSFKFLNELDKRAKAFKRQAIWAIATDVKEAVVAKIPNDKQYDKLKKSLKVGEIAGNKEPSFAIFIDSKSTSVKKIEVNKTLIFIRQRKIPSRVKPEIQILIDRGPWTVDTLPFWPSNKDAVTVQRKVDVPTVNKIQKLQNSQKEEIRSKLIKVGAKGVADSMRKKASKLSLQKAIPDVAFQMQTLEFGGGTQRPVAPWRLALAQIKNMSKTIANRYKKISETFSDLRSQNWQKYPIVNDKVKSSLVQDADNFIKRIGGK